MGGFFGTVAKASCVEELFYGTELNSHLGTKRGGLATYDQDEAVFTRSIHNLESTYFRTKFEDELDKFKGNSGIGIISDARSFCHSYGIQVYDPDRVGNRTSGAKYALCRIKLRQNQSNGTYRFAADTR